MIPQIEWMLVIYKGQASCPSQIFDPSAIYRWKHGMESSSEAGLNEDANLPKGKKMRWWNPRIIKFIICVLTPLLLSPLVFSSDKVKRCGFVILLMVIFWMLEPVHITVTALLPIPLMPLLGILDVQEVAPNYMKEVLMMFLGGIGMAIAVEHSKLHERIALKVLLTVGSDTKWLMLGFMSTAMFLSMWVSNTATTAMMVPIIDAVMRELNAREKEEEEIDRKEFEVLHKTLLLSVAYSANTGGTGTMTGTSPNMIFKGYVEEFYPESTEITYASWIAYNAPTMVLVVFTAWLVLQAMYIPCWRREDTESKERIRSVILSRYKKLGRMTFHEAAILSLFILLVLLWFFREPKFMPGWAEQLPVDTKIGDAVPAIGVLILLFLLPAEPWKTYKSRPLLTWKVMQEKMKWGLLLLLGGGYALADGAQKSGLSGWLGKEMSRLSFLPPCVILIIIWLITTGMTEIMSNSTITAIMIPILKEMKSGFSEWLGVTMSSLSYLPPSVILIILWLVTTTITEFMTNSAVATIMIPIVNEMALASNINPIYFMLPVTVIASQAYMLPVATGPNAIVFGTGTMKTSDMIKPGLVMNLIAGCIQLVVVHTYGNFLFNLNVVPNWALPNNSTLLRRNFTILH